MTTDQHIVSSRGLLSRSARYRGRRGFTWASLLLFGVLVTASLLRTTGHGAFSSIDEDAHFDYAYVLTAGSLPPTGDQPTRALTREIFVCRGGLGNTWPVLIACTDDHDTAGFPFGGRSRALGNPPTWYLLAAGGILVAAPAGVDPLTAARTVGILTFGAGSVLLLWALRAFRIALAPAIGVTLLVASLPNAFYLGGFAMPHSGYLLAGSGLLLIAVAFIRRPRWSLAAALVLGCALAMLVMPHMVAAVTCACALVALAGLAALPRTGRSPQPPGTQRGGSPPPPTTVGPEWLPALTWPMLAGAAGLAGLLAWAGMSRLRGSLGLNGASGLSGTGGTGLVNVAAPNPYAVPPATLAEQVLQWLRIGPGGQVMFAHREWNATNTLDLWWNPVTALAVALAGAAMVWALLGRDVPRVHRLLAAATLIGLAVAVLGINRAFWMTLEELPLRYYAAATPALAILIAALARRPAAAWALTGVGGLAFLAVYTTGPLW